MSPSRFKARNPPAGWIVAKKQTYCPLVSQLWRYSCFPSMLTETTLYELKRLLFIQHYCNCTINIFKKRFKNKIKLVKSHCVCVCDMLQDKNILKTSCGLSISHLYFFNFFFKQCCGTQVNSLKKRAQKFFFSCK